MARPRRVESFVLTETLDEKSHGIGYWGNYTVHMRGTVTGVGVSTETVADAVRNTEKTALEMVNLLNP